MRRDWVNLFLLVFTTVFLNVVVPAHARGAVTMEGSEGPTNTAGCDAPKDAADPQKPTCAVCVVAARYLPAATTVYAPPALCFVGLVTPPPPAATNPTAARTYDACGPPASR
jgi:hypothetical protein